MNVTNIIRGVVNATKYTVTAPIIKEDYGLYLKIEGLDLPAVYEVDFSNSENSGSSVTMVGNADGVLIPRQFIKSGQDVFAFLYWNGEDFGRTVYKFRIPNKLRPDRTEEQPTPEEQSLIDQAISALNSAVEQTAADVETTTAKAAEATAAAHTATQKALEATESAQSAGTYATRAETAQRAAETARTASQQSATASATSAEQAAGSALTASTKAGEASASASAAAQSAIDARDYKDAANLFAESASGYAGAASESATSASESASTATTKASEAAQSATTATAKAGEASASATAAQTAQTAAEAAQTAAETAQGLAEDAQTGAETAQAAAEAAIYTKADGITDTATGAVASFPDGADDFPMKSLKVAIDTVQDLHGYENPWPAGGGKNVLNPEYLTDNYTLSNVTGLPVFNSGQVATTSPTNISGTNVTVSFTSGVQNTRFIVSLLANGEKIYRQANLSSGQSVDITGADTIYLSFYSNDGNVAVSDLSNVQLEYGSTATSYAPYSNICPITGWTGAQVARTGVNIWDEEWELGRYTSGNKTPNSNMIRCKNYIPVKPNTTYYFNKGVNNGNIWTFFYDRDKACLNPTSNGTNANNGAVTTPDNCYCITFFLSAQVEYQHDVSINYPSTDHDYHAYTGNTYSVSWLSTVGTVYGGTLDVVSGELVVDMASVDLGTLTWIRIVDAGLTAGAYFKAYVSGYKAITHNRICSIFSNATENGLSSAIVKRGVDIDNIMFNDSSSASNTLYIVDSSYTDATTFKSAMDGVQFVYELAEPITYHLTPTEVRTLLGQNNVWADTGNSTVEYYADTKRYIDKKITEIV